MNQDRKMFIDKSFEANIIELLNMLYELIELICSLIGMVMIVLLALELEKRAAKKSS